jgi:hypothetical protein
MIYAESQNLTGLCNVHVTTQSFSRDRLAEQAQAVDVFFSSLGWPDLQQAASSTKPASPMALNESGSTR